MVDHARRQPEQRRPPPWPARRSRCRRASQCGLAGHGWLGGCVLGCHRILLADVTDLSPTRLPGSPEHQHRRHPAARKGRGRYRLKDCGHSQRVRHRANAFRIAGPDLDPLTGCAAMRSRAVPVKRLPCPDLEGPGPAPASRTQPAAPRLTRGRTSGSSRSPQAAASAARSRSHAASRPTKRKGFSGD